MPRRIVYTAVMIYPHPLRPHCTRHAFSLMEMALVIAIIGLLIGGVVATQSYIKNAELSTMVNEAKFHLDALKQFERAYQGLPGDLANASSYWSSAANGNGNGIIGNGNSPEYFSAFTHLRLGKFITPNYTGVAGSAGALDGDVGVNIPQLTGTGIGLYAETAGNGGYHTGFGTYYDGYYGTYVVVARETTGNSLPSNGFLAPESALQLDAKFDNGVPSTGTVRARGATSCSSATAYDVASTAESCSFIMTYQ